MKFRHAGSFPKMLLLTHQVRKPRNMNKTPGNIIIGLLSLPVTSKEVILGWLCDKYKGHFNGWASGILTPMNYNLWRKRLVISILAVLTALIVAWNLSGLLTEESFTKHALRDDGQRCKTVLQQLKLIKTHPKDKAS